MSVSSPGQGVGMSGRFEDQFRLILERPMGPRESRVCREERLLRSRDEAVKLAGYWQDRLHPDGVRGWVEKRSVTLWEDFRP